MNICTSSLEPTNDLGLWKMTLNGVYALTPPHIIIILPLSELGVRFKCCDYASSLLPG